MSFADDAEFAAFLGRDHMLLAVTPEAVASAMVGFALPLSPGKELDWLAMAVRRALGISIPNVSDGPERPSNAEFRDELVSLAERATETWIAIFQRSPEADSRLWDEAFNQWEGCNALAAGDDPEFEYNRFRAALAELNWLSSFLGKAVKGTEQQKPNWRAAERKRIRVQRGLYLAPIFEAAFGTVVSANNWPSGVHRAPSAFMDFYQRMVALAFGEQRTPDLSGVLKAVCRMHRQYPTTFADGVIPGL
ncbi:hypothetical protein OLX02_13915 [Novosphingobium sp. KCTC 2891]|uniref:hypothetical protein n=1 Tax=Novosphingobium sp. KCTC 2891 TaxID=2989730 RepID=UPI0022221D46|nr:hypothetical protein [Novosphingobium sp. KCTC 2891]MCW1383915.1 hypothetical protein [Novosphingobium sp. KCTC 2891]